MKIEFYNSDVYADLMNWPRGIKAKFVRVINFIKENNLLTEIPDIRSMGDSLFEIRVRSHEGIGRVFFCYKQPKKIVILYGFIKKTQKTPNRILKIVRNRMKEVV